MAVELTLSSSQGNTAEVHDRRLFTPRNADKALEKYNEEFVSPQGKTDAELFNEVYQKDVDAFNAKQTRNDRKMGPESTKESRQKTYYDGLIDGTFCYGKGKTKEEPIYEAVIQIGNKDDCGVTDDKFDSEYWKKLKLEDGDEAGASAYALQHFNNNARMKDCKEILKKSVEDIVALDPEHLIILAAFYHCDEPMGTPHAHIVYTLRATEYKKGMENRVGSVKALAQMGFEKTMDSEYGITQLHEKFKDVMEEEMIIQNPTLRRKALSGQMRGHATPDEFKALMRQQEINKRYWEESVEKEENAKLLQQTAEITLQQAIEKEEEIADAWAEFEEEKAGDMADIIIEKQKLADERAELDAQMDAYTAHMTTLQELVGKCKQFNLDAEQEQNTQRYSPEEWLKKHKRNGKTLWEIYLKDKELWENKPHLGAGLSKKDLQNIRAELIEKAEQFETGDIIKGLQK